MNDLTDDEIDALLGLVNMIPLFSSKHDQDMKDSLKTKLEEEQFKRRIERMLD